MFLTFVKNLKLRKEISTLITSFIVLICLYITFVSVLHRQFLFPFVPENNKTNKTELNKQQININSSSFEEIKNNFLSIFFLWASALIAGKAAYYARMPPLLGN